MSKYSDIAEKVERVLKELKEINELARSSNLYGVERLSEHLISHTQTILESLKKTE